MAKRPTQAEVDVVRAFAHQAQALFDLQWRRAETFERRASILLGFAGAAFPLLLSTVGQQVTRSEFGAGSGSLLLVGTAALLACAVFAFQAIRPRKFASPAPEQLRDEWRAYDEGTDRPVTELLGMFTDSLIGKEPDAPNAIQSVTADADARSKWVTAGGAALTVAVLCLACAFSLELWEGVIQ